MKATSITSGPEGRLGASYPSSSSPDPTILFGNKIFNPFRPQAGSHQPSFEGQGTLDQAPYIKGLLRGESHVQGRQACGLPWPFSATCACGCFQ